MHQGTPEVRGHAGDASDGHPGLLRLPHLDGPIGGDEQQDPDHAAAGLRLPRPGVLQTEDLRPPRGQVRFSRMSPNNYLYTYDLADAPPEKGKGIAINRKTLLTDRNKAWNPF